METSLGQASTVWNSELGEFISEDHRRFAEVLKDLKPTYSLVYIPKADRVSPDEIAKPWAILEQVAGKPQYIVRYLSEVEMSNPQAILAWCLAGDLDRNRPGDVWRRIEAEENARQLMALKKREDELEDIMEFGAFVATGGRNKQHTFKHNGQTYRR